MFKSLKIFGNKKLPHRNEISILKTRTGLSLEAPQATHYESWRDVRSNNKEFLQPWEPKWANNELSPAAFKQRVQRAEELADTQQGASFLLIDQKNVIGGVSLFNVRRGASQSGLIGYWLCESHNRKGHMSSAVDALCQHGFDRLKLHRIEASCLPKNTRSINLLKRCSFEQEGTCKSYLEINGKREDHLLFAKLK